MLEYFPVPKIDQLRLRIQENLRQRDLRQLLQIENTSFAAACQLKALLDESATLLTVATGISDDMDRATRFGDPFIHRRRVLGACIATMSGNNDEGKVCEIVDLFEDATVLPQRRVMHFLMSHLMCVQETDGWSHIRVAIQKGNDLIPFFQELGFQHIGTSHNMELDIDLCIHKWPVRHRK